MKKSSKEIKAVDVDTVRNNNLKMNIADTVRKALDTSRSGVIESINKNNDAIDKINCDIERMLIARNALLRDNYDLTANIVGAQHFLYISKKDLEKEFNDKHFESGKVKDAVMHVRMVFFDDTQEICQKYNCVDIKFDDWNNNNRIGFVFSNKEREFTLSLPLNCDVTAEEIQKHENCGGKMYISFWRHESFCDLTYGTLSVDEIRKTIYDFMTVKDLKDFKTDPIRLRRTLDDILNAQVSGNSILRNHMMYRHFEDGNLIYQYSTVSF